MAYKGQPVPTEVYSIGNGKVSDGKSVRVTVSGGASGVTIEAGKFYLVQGFLGCAFTTVEVPAGETVDVILNIEQAEYETDQINTNDDFEVGATIYWDDTNKVFTEDSSVSRLAGRVTAAKDENNVIRFVLGPQV